MYFLNKLPCDLVKGCVRRDKRGRAARNGEIWNKSRGAHVLNQVEMIPSLPVQAWGGIYGRKTYTALNSNVRHGYGLSHPRLASVSHSKEISTSAWVFLQRIFNV